ncbi:MAG: hypothetical protein AB7Q42_02775 [Acidimicrobiia bacterium]
MPKDQDQDQGNGSEDRVDELARRAGAALRRPAPAEGIGRVRSSRRRRLTARAVAGGSAVVVMGVGLFVVLDRGADDGRSVTDSVPETVLPDTGSTSTSPTDTTEPPTTVPPTTVPPTTVPSDGSGWQSATERFPALSFIPCCGTNWEGEPSPAVPADRAAPLPAGIYNVRAVADDQSAVDVVDGILTLEVRPYTSCSELGEFGCGGDPPYDDTELGVPTDAARTIDVTLDDSVRVGVHGFACANDRLDLDQHVSTGTDLAKLFVELDASYETAVAEPLRSGVDSVQVADDLAANPTSGFFDPGCPSYTRLAWTPPSGPTILASTLGRLTPDTSDDALALEPLPSAAAHWITPTALVVDVQGNYTVYLYAGFLS